MLRCTRRKASYRRVEPSRRKASRLARAVRLSSRIRAVPPWTATDRDATDRREIFLRARRSLLRLVSAAMVCGMRRHPPGSDGAENPGYLDRRRRSLPYRQEQHQHQFAQRHPSRSATPGNDKSPGSVRLSEIFVCLSTAAPAVVGPGGARHRYRPALPAGGLMACRPLPEYQHVLTYLLEHRFE